MKFLKLEDLDVNGKTVLLRVDLNVPMQGGRITDNTRILRLLPTLHYLIAQRAKIVLLSHFDRPKGKFVPSLSLAPLVDAVSAALDGKEIKFGVDCIGAEAQNAVAALQPGDIILLENLRFHPEEEAGDREFARALASLGDVYVNDAFSSSHRAHASVTGIAEFLPMAAGPLMQQELNVLGKLFSGSEKPLAGIIGGAKVSTKLELLESLSQRMDILIIGGAMANTFFHAQGHNIGRSLHEPGLKDTANAILQRADAHGCRILLPVDVVVTSAFEPHAPCQIADIDAIPAGSMAVDIGPESVRHYAKALIGCHTVVWNGPVGAFEVSPFDTSTIQLARVIAQLTAKQGLRSIAGGGDTVAALRHSGLADSFSYLSTAGGAFLEWLEGKTLPGVAALLGTQPLPRASARH